MKLLSSYLLHFHKKRSILKQDLIPRNCFSLLCGICPMKTTGDAVGEATIPNILWYRKTLHEKFQYVKKKSIWVRMMTQILVHSNDVCLLTLDCTVVLPPLFKPSIGMKGFRMEKRLRCHEDVAFFVYSINIKANCMKFRFHILNVLFEEILCCLVYFTG